MPYQDDPLFSLEVGTSAEDVSISKVMQRYVARNCKFFLFLPALYEVPTISPCLLRYNFEFFPRVSNGFMTFPM